MFETVFHKFYCHGLAGYHVLGLDDLSVTAGSNVLEKLVFPWELGPH